MAKGRAAGSGAKKEKMVEPIPEPMESAMLYKHQALRDMVEMVVHRRGLIGIPGKDWFDAVIVKLKDVGVVTVRDFWTSVVVNQSDAHCGRALPIP
jgi:hypothetical protein